MKVFLNRCTDDEPSHAVQMFVESCQQESSWFARFMLRQCIDVAKKLDRDIDACSRRERIVGLLGQLSVLYALELRLIEESLVVSFFLSAVFALVFAFLMGVPSTALGNTITALMAVVITLIAIVISLSVGKNVRFWSEVQGNCETIFRAYQQNPELLEHDLRVIGAYDQELVRRYRLFLREASRKSGKR